MAIWHSGKPRIRSSGLEVPCYGCKSKIPYDPTDSTGLCSNCRHEATEPVELDSDNLVSTSKVHRGNNFTGLPMTPSNNPKRWEKSLDYSEPSSKAIYTKTSGSSNSPIIRRTVMSPAARAYETSMDVSDDEDEDNFEDAQEELLPTRGDEDFTGILGEVDDEEDEIVVAGKALHDDEEEEEGSMHSSEADGYERIDSASDDEGGVNDDLFNTTFGNRSSRESNSDGDGEEEDDEDEMEISKGSNESQQRDSASIQDDGSGEEDDEELTSARMKESPSTNTSPVGSGDLARAGRNKTGPFTAATVAASGGSTRAVVRLGPPDPYEDRSNNLKKQQIFHNKAKDLIPRLPLADHRYWIGVLNLDVSPKSFNNEKHFTWMKGNRFTTVSTVWHTYQTTTATDNFVLLLGSERVAFTDKVEELDYFNDKKIMFRAVWEGSREAKGKELCEGVVPPADPVEVIEID